MRPDDVKQLEEVEKDAFPTLSPPTPFKREADNKLACYLIAIPEIGHYQGAELNSINLKSSSTETLFSTVYQWIGVIQRFLFSTSPRQPRELIFGYLGLWRVVDDAHIVSVGVRTPYRRNGIGEGLLIRAIDKSVNWGGRNITLEVRVSNIGAQSLYTKYGFKKAGIRKRYYLDNDEDAYIMTTDTISSPQYRNCFQRLKSIYHDRQILDFQSSTGT